MDCSYKELHPINKVAEKDPQKAMGMLAERSAFTLSMAISSATSRGGMLLGHRIDHLNGLQKWCKNQLSFDKTHHNSGMVDQDRIIIKSVKTYSKSHAPSEWTNIDVDYNADRYTLKPVTADNVSDITFAMMNNNN